ncbi:MAG: carboxypeptidase regulatory-like domain-containing protein [Bryobacterales bacterium]|nr:carboxypeptidase regulatory-like domain-containing protein [Bryobacterales bacterium]MBV9397375.1 carboxypeptidase regulatory-like domain-containing protein [Bryobacterales bacterium]
MKKLFASVLLALLPVGALPARAEKKTKLEIHVTNQEGKPVGNASVIVKFVNSSLGVLKTKKSWELRTSQEGMARIPDIPRGKVQIQVIAKNYQTFGDTFDVKEEERTIDIVLNLPQQQYSAHGPNDPTAGGHK